MAKGHCACTNHSGIQHVLQSLACFEGKILYGRIDDTVSSSEDDLGMVTINRCTIGGNRHPVHGMPMLQRNDGVFVTVLSQVGNSTHTSPTCWYWLPIKAVWLTSSLIRAKREWGTELWGFAIHLSNIYHFALAIVTRARLHLDPAMSN